jgi:hypothetical protein
MARGKHLFPFRTEQLSPSAPMVLGSQGPGRVGRRRFLQQARAPLRRGPRRFEARVTASLRDNVRIPSAQSSGLPTSPPARRSRRTRRVALLDSLIGAVPATLARIAGAPEEPRRGPCRLPRTGHGQPPSFSDPPRAYPARGLGVVIGPAA